VPDPRAQEVMSATLGLTPVLSQGASAAAPGVASSGASEARQSDSATASLGVNPNPSALETALYGNRQPSAPATFSAPVQIGVAWTGLDYDVVGTGTNGNPDGAADGHWRMTVVLAAPQVVSYIAIRSADQSGNIVGPHHWNTGDPRFWVLAVYANGQRLNASHVANLGTWQGQVHVDLFGSNPGDWFARGRFTVVDIGLANGQVIRGFAPL
jgi:hypothetical protein